MRPLKAARHAVSSLLSENRIEFYLGVLLVVTVAVASVSAVILFAQPRIGEAFTEFYILGSNGKAGDYPSSLAHGQNYSISIGLVNHEYRTVNYSVQVWLLEFDFVNGSDLVRHLFFFDQFNVTLSSIPIKVNEPFTKQWEINYTFSIETAGNHELLFVVFKDSVPSLAMNPEKSTDYVESGVLNELIAGNGNRAQNVNLRLTVV